MTDYKSRLIINTEQDIDASGTQFVTLSGTNINLGYERIVIGQRGPYVEFTEHQLFLNNFHIPEQQQYRVTDNGVYYVELRTNDPSHVMTYLQKRCVNYADYKVGYFYMSPFDLYLTNGQTLIEKIKKR